MIAKVVRLLVPYLLTAVGVVEAAPAVGVSSLRGGSMIDLGQLDARSRSNHEEVTVAVSGTSSQYRISQVFSSPLMSERGFSLDPEPLAMEITGGESGTVKFRGASRIPGGALELFTSNASGQTDQLKIIYSIRVEELPQAGTYTGAVTFTLELIDGSSIQHVTVPIRLRVDPATALRLADYSADRLRFGRVDPGKTSEPQRISLEVQGNLPGAFQVVHAVEAPPINEAGDPLPLHTMQLRVLRGGSVTFEDTVQPRLTLMSGEWDERLQRIDLTYVASVAEDQPAGLYRGLVSIALAGASTAGGGEPVIVQLPMELEVTSILSLSVQSEHGGPLELAFLNLEPGTVSEPKTLRLNVQTNLRRGYEISQEFSGPLVSLRGYQLPADALIYHASGVGEGQIVSAQEVPVSVGRSLVYQSDERGTPIELALQYRIRVPPDATADTYRSTLWCSVTAR